ncbi:MAG: hypothetical protein ACOCRK_05500 [bacterium]
MEYEVVKAYGNFKEGDVISEKDIISPPPSCIRSGCSHFPNIQNVEEDCKGYIYMGKNDSEPCCVEGLIRGNYIHKYSKYQYFLEKEVSNV